MSSILAKLIVGDLEPTEGANRDLKTSSQASTDSCGTGWGFRHANRAE